LEDEHRKSMQRWRRGGAAAEEVQEKQRRS
jgi:hypothetical protein